MIKIFLQTRLFSLLLLGLLAFSSLRTYAQTYTTAWARFFGGDGFDNSNNCKVDENYIYVIGQTTSKNLPVTNSSSFPLGLNQSGFYAKFNRLSGDLVFATYLHNPAYQTADLLPLGLEIENGNVYITGVGGPLLNSLNPNQGPIEGELFIMKYNVSDVQEYARYIGGSEVENMYAGIQQLAVKNGIVALTFKTPSADLPVTNGSTKFSSNGNEDLAILKLGTSGEVLYCSYLFDGSYQSVNDIEIYNNNIYLVGVSSLSTFPAIGGGVANTGGVFSAFYMRIDESNNIVYATSFNGEGTALAVKVVDGDVYLAGNALNFRFPRTTGSLNGGVFLMKLNNNNQMLYSSILGGSSNSGYFSFLEIENGIAYMLLKPSNTYPSTDGTVYAPGGAGMLAKFDATSGERFFSTYINNISSTFGSNSIMDGLAVHNGTVGIVGWVIRSDFQVTNGSSYSGNGDLFFRAYKPNGTILFSSYYGGSERDLNNSYYWALGVLYNYKNCFYFISNTNSTDFPVTMPPVHGGGDEFQSGNETVVVGLSFDPQFTLINTLSPITQSPCLNGYVETIIGNTISSPDGTYLPHYQWQSALSASGAWTNIEGAISKDLKIDSTFTYNKYYRRIALSDYNCSNTMDTISISNVSTVNGSLIVAPTANAGEDIYACAGTTLTFGTAPTGGLAPFTFDWYFGNVLLGAPYNTATLTAPIGASTLVATVKVTDSNTCVDYDQITINVPTPDAGANVFSCEGMPVQIGTVGYPTSTGISYAWTPVTGLSCTTCAQPLASPSVTTKYYVDMTVNNPQGSPCTLRDSVIVTVVNSPGANFAGADRIICSESSTTLGIPSVSGFTYTWSSMNGLDNPSIAQPLFDGSLGGLYSSISENPRTFVVKATLGTCEFYDDVVVTMMQSSRGNPPSADVFGMAGEDGCGPRIIGMPDYTPNVNETYQWTTVSGPSSFLGSTTDPEIPVGGSQTLTTVYGLTTTFSGHTCYDEVLVPPCECKVRAGLYKDCVNRIVKVFAYEESPVPGTYSWTPTIGLSSYNIKEPICTDQIPRTYTVRYTSTIDPSVSCTWSVDTDFDFTLPTFEAPSVTLCPGQSINIGDPAGTGSATWLDPSNLNCTNCLNPLYTANGTFNSIVTNDYIVRVIDLTSSCTIEDTAHVTVKPVLANAGLDVTVCNSAIVTLGTPDPVGSGWTYSWNPPIAPWQNGTDEFDAQPQVLVAGTVEYDVLVTDPATGCSDRDTIRITESSGAPTADAGSPQSLCIGGSGVQIGTAAVSGVEYSWSPSVGLSCTTCAQPIATPPSTQEYTLEVKYAGNCVTVAQATVLVTVNPLPTFDLGSNIISCPSTPINIGSSAPAGMSIYAWTPSTGLSASGVQNPTSTALVTTTYTLNVTDANGCQATDNITVTPGSTPNAGVDRTLCLGSSTVLGDVSNSSSATWSTASGLSCTTCAQPTFTPSSVGTFTKTISQTEGGCTATDDVIINVVSETAPIVATPIPMCQNSCVQIGVANDPTKTYLWSPITGLDDYTKSNPIVCVGNSSINYSLKVTNSGTGCSASVSVPVEVVPSPAPILAIEDITTCNGQSSVLDLEVTGAGSYTYYWTPSTGLTSNNIQDPTAYGTPLGTRTYTVEVTDNTTGCKSQTDVNVSVIVCINLSGHVWNDYDTNIAVQNTNEPKTNTGSGTPLYVYLIDPATNLVIDKALIGPDGNYSFTIDAYSNYQLILTTTDVNIGDSKPTVLLPSGWTGTGDNQDGTIDIIAPVAGDLRVSSSITNIVNQNFGIEQIPSTIDQSYNISQPVLNSNQSLTTTNGMNLLSGTDPEDGAKGWGNSFTIVDTIGMNGNTLWYDADGDGIMDAGEEVLPGATIANYNPNNLHVSFTGAGSTSFTFQYVSIDAAGKTDPTPNEYTVSWLSPLPITLLNFSVKALGKTSLLEWSTSSETNNSHFNVQHLNGFGQWEFIGKVNGNGTTTAQHNYSLIHSNPINGMNYYRLEIVSKDNKIEYSKIVSVKFNDINKILLYPNPTSNTVFISFEHSTENESLVKIFDMTGKIVKEEIVEKNTNQREINISSLAVGIYQVRILSKNTNEVYEFVKQ
jgi:hypothetical protein